MNARVNPNTLIAEAVDAFLAHIEREGKTESTLRNYRADLSALLRSAGYSAQAVALTRAAQRHLDELRLAERSWNRHLSSLRQFCEYLVRIQALQSNPLRSTSRAEVSRKETRPLGAALIDRLLRRVKSPRDRALVALLRDTGLRIGEALALRVCDINSSSGTVTVRVGARRSLNVSPGTRVLVGDYLMKRDASSKEPLFSTYGGRALSYAGAYRLFRSYAGDSGLTMQQLRASAAAKAFHRGASLAQVQRMLGHAHAESTVRYQVHDLKMSKSRPDKSRRKS